MKLIKRWPFIRVVFAIDGEIYIFRNGQHYMFADKHVYEDGTMEELIKEIEGY